MTDTRTKRQSALDPGQYAFERVQRAIVQQIIDDMPATMTATQLAATLGKAPSWVRAQVSSGTLIAPKRSGQWAISRNRNRAFIYAYLTHRGKLTAQMK